LRARNSKVALSAALFPRRLGLLCEAAMTGFARQAHRLLRGFVAVQDDAPVGQDERKSFRAGAGTSGWRKRSTFTHSMKPATALRGAKRRSTGDQL
jgi:hypothetical protein